jgi:hypothetical protein
VPFEGELAPNDKLTQAEYHAKGKVFGPESIVFTHEALMYTGLANGYIVRVHKDGGIAKVAQMGNEPNITLCGI